MGRHVALYLRISSAEGRNDKIEDQERWGREYAAATWPGLPVVAYSDNDISATKGDPRPGYRALREAIASGQVAELWVKEQSRIERLELEWFGFAAFAAAHGLTKIHTRQEGVVAVGGLVAGLKAVISANEIATMRGRIMDRLDKIADSGVPPGSQPFGYAHGVNAQGVRTYVQVPEQAEAIRWAAEKVLAGWSLSMVAEALRERGLAGPHRMKVKGPDGEPVRDAQGNVVTRASRLTVNSVRRMLTVPSVAGHRVHQGHDRGPGTGNWEPILDEEAWQACRDKLRAGHEVRRSDGGTYVVGGTTSYAGRRYLLTGGLAVCGVCGAKLDGTAKQIPGKPDRPYLICHKRNRRPDGTAAGSCVGIMLAETEQYVIDELFAELDNPAFLAALAADDHAERRQEITGQLRALEGQRKELAALWAIPGELTTAEWGAARQGLDAQENQLRASLTEVPAPLAGVDVGAAREAWPHMELAEQREFIRLFIARVQIHRAKPGTRGFDPARVQIEWARA